MKVYKVGRMAIAFSLAPKGTIWWSAPRKYRHRDDHLISLIRTFHRNERIYTYEINLGRFKLIWGRKSL